jgi:Flp pilus assembly pilin Flp
MLKRLWNDEAGFVVSAELVLIATILVIGLIVGWATVRDQVVQELGDVAAAIAVINQSYTWSAVTGHTSSVAGTYFDDTTDFCDEDPNPPGTEPLCIDLLVDATVGEDT